MRRSSKIVLGILTFLPVVLFILYFVWFFFMFTTAFELASTQYESQDDMNPTLIAGGFRIAFFIIFALIISTLGLMIYYIVHANRNPRFDSNQKLIWTLILIFANGVGNIVYYFMEIVPSGKKEIPSSAAPTRESQE